MATTIASAIYNADAGYSLSAAEEAKYTTGGSSTAYTSFNTWESGRDRDLVAADEVEKGDILGSNGWTGASDTGASTFNGWTMDGTRYVHIEAIDEARSSNGAWDVGAYINHGNGVIPLSIVSSTTNILLDGIQFEMVGNTTSRQVLQIQNGPRVEVKNCFFMNGSSVTNFTIRAFGNGAVFIWNSIIQGTGSVGTSGIHCSTTVHVINSIVTEIASNGIDSNNDAVTVYNSVVFNNGNDFEQTFSTIGNCASDDNDGTNPQNLNENAGSEWDNSFTDYANGDWTPKAATTTCLLYNNGVDLTGTYADLSGVDPLITDIVGNTRDANWEIGPYNLSVGAAGLGIPIVMHHRGIQAQ